MRVGSAGEEDSSLVKEVLSSCDLWYPYHRRGTGKVPCSQEPWVEQRRVPSYPGRPDKTYHHLAGRSTRSQGPVASVRRRTRQKDRCRGFHWDSHPAEFAACTAHRRVGVDSHRIQDHPGQGAVNVAMGHRSHEHYRTHCVPMARPVAAWHRYRNDGIGLLVS